jgi:hypothetical protein
MTAAGIVAAGAVGKDCMDLPLEPRSDGKIRKNVFGSNVQHQLWRVPLTLGAWGKTSGYSRGRRMFGFNHNFLQIRFEQSTFDGR